ncbi:MAG: carbon storage regulator [Chromatiales bacterium]|nr:carbon storage regulator [Chromatiales bacterium]
MLILTRKPGQALTIRPDQNLDLTMPIEQLFADGPIRVLVAGVSGPQVRLGVAADSRLTILRDELLAQADSGPLPADVRAVFARKLRVLRFMRRHSAESLATCAGVSLATVLGAERGAGVVDIDDLERLARALGVGIADLFREPGRTAEERVVMAVLRGLE